MFVLHVVLGNPELIDDFLSYKPRVIGKFPMSHVTPEGIYTGWWFHTFFIFHDIWDNLSH